MLRLLTLGATVHDLEVTGGDGVRRHVALGLATAADYLASTDYLGGTIGRYANRIRDGHLPLPDGEHQLGTHDRGQHLHGGPDGFDRRLWQLTEHDERRARLRLVSPHGDQGFPGELVVDVVFTVVDAGVDVELAATTDRTTVVNLTQHLYVNLEGHDAGTIDDHLLEVPAVTYTPVDATGIPLGEHAPVAGTALDLRTPTRLGAAGALDHNLVVDGLPAERGLRTMCVLSSPATRTRFELRSDQPGLQVYTGDGLGSGGHGPRAGVALEPQLFPDSPHHPAWPSALLEPGETYRARHEWRFGSVADPGAWSDRSK